MKFSEAARIFFEVGRASYATRTLTLYFEHLTRFNKFIHDKDIESVSITKDIIGYRNSLELKGVSDNTINLSMISLRQMWKLLCGLERELKIELPFLWSSIPYKRSVFAKSYKPITAEEFQKLLLQINGKNGFLLARDTAMFRMFYDTGMRLSELTSLDISAINEKEQSCKVITRKRRDSSRYRLVPWTRETHKALITYLDIRKVYSGSDALFISLKTGERVNKRTIERTLKKYAKKAELDYSAIKVHGFRHGVGARAVEAEMYLPNLQALLGHAHLSSSAVYYNVKNKAVEREYHQKLGDFATVAKV